MATPPVPEQGASNTVTEDRHIPSSQPHELVDELNVHTTPSNNAPTPARKEIQVAECLDPYQCETLLVGKEVASSVTKAKPSQEDQEPQHTVLFQQGFGINAAVMLGSLQSTHQPDSQTGSQIEHNDLEVDVLRDGCDLSTCEADLSPHLWEEVALMESSEATEMHSDLVVEPVHIAADTPPGVDSRQWNAGEERIGLSQYLKKFANINEIERTKDLDYVHHDVIIVASAREKAGIFESFAQTNSSLAGPQLGSLSCICSIEIMPKSTTHFKRMKDAAVPHIATYYTQPTQAQSWNNDHLWFSFSHKLHPDWYHTVRTTPHLPIHWVKVSQPDGFENQDHIQLESGSSESAECVLDFRVTKQFTCWLHWKMLPRDQSTRRNGIR